MTMSTKNSKRLPTLGRRINKRKNYDEWIEKGENTRTQYNLGGKTENNHQSYFGTFIWNEVGLFGENVK